MAVSCIDSCNTQIVTVYFFSYIWVILLVLFCPVKNVHVIHCSIREILDSMNVFFSWKMRFNYFVQILALVLSFLPSAVIFSVQYAHSTIYRSYAFFHLFLSLWFIRIFHWSSFLREKMWFEKMETFIEKFWFHWSKQELHWLFCWLGPEHLPRNQLMASVGGNVMIEWAVDLLCLQEEISRFFSNSLLSRSSEVQ